MALIDKRLVGNLKKYRRLDKDKDEVGQMMPWPLTRHALPMAIFIPRRLMV